MSKSQIAAENLAVAIQHVIVPRAGKVPADMWALHAIAVNGFCPVKSVSHRTRADHIACLIDSTLVEAGR